MPRKTKTPQAKNARQPAAARLGGHPGPYTENQVKDALRRSGGNYSEAAHHLATTYGRPISRKTIALYVGNSASLRALLVQLNEVQGDFVERQFWQLIEAGNPSAIHFALSTKFKDRGYAKTTEISGPNGGPIPVARQLPLDLSGLTDKELAVLGRILDKVSAEEPAARNGATAHPTNGAFADVAAAGPI
jgi:hypothetical protein